MAPTGKPSRGCYRCRQRRIKCDLELPGCRKCLHLGQPCPGYRQDSELLFHNENAESYPNSVLRDRRKANIGSSSVLPSRTLPSIATQVDVEEMAPQIALFDKLVYSHETPSWGLSQTFDDHAVSFVISIFSTAITDGERFYGFMDFFPEIAAKATEESPIVLCCKAVALMYFNNRYSSTAEETTQRIAAYGKALSATNAALSHQDLRSNDETLVSIWLLSIYETLCGATMSLQSPGRPPTWNMHILGLKSLIRMRARQSLSSGNGGRFFWMLIGVVESRSLATGEECPGEVFNWLEEHITDFVPGELDMHHILVHGFHASVLCAKIRKIIDTEDLEHFQTINEVVEEARRLGGEGEARLAQDPVNRFLHLRRAHIHNFHRAVRLHIQYSILELLQSDFARRDSDLSPKFCEKQQNLSISIIQNLTQDTLKTVPLILGPKSPTQMTMVSDEDEIERPRCWADGMRLLWPLRVIGSRMVISNEQRKTVEESLKRLSSELCMRVAVVPYAIPKQWQLARRAQANAYKRSKACITCRRRKVKCDEEKPLCQRCGTSQLDCEGYEDPFVMIDPSSHSMPDHDAIERLDESTLAG